LRPREIFWSPVDFEDFDLEFLADGEHVFGLGDAGVGDVADVEQAVDAAEVDECAVGHEGADGAGDDVAFLDGLIAAGLGAGAGLLFEHHAAIDDDIFIGDVELGDAAGDLGADQLFELGGVAGSAAAGGHEGADADVDAQAALDDFGDGADDGELLGEGCFEGGPVAGLRDFEARELVVAFFVAAGDGDRKVSPGLTASALRCFRRRSGAERPRSCSRCRERPGRRRRETTARLGGGGPPVSSMTLLISPRLSRRR
jgi:hypothetical protein